jgi:tetratricopeptide (TPR) repeat protein/tRNA A-37 threonylcarbamoyl transferase component Bud32
LLTPDQLAHRGNDVQPRAISHFDILAQIAAGGMGVVYRARDRVLDRDVALKLIRPERAGDAEARRRFVREARAAAVLHHPGIAAIYEAGEAKVEGLGDDPQLYLAEELIEGETLTARIARGRVQVEEVIDWGLQLAEALGAAHDRGVVHRDIKPSNVMVTPAGVLKILDFGVAKHGVPTSDSPTVEAVAETLTGVLAGTPAYMAPEQIAGDPASPHVDVYAAGCVLYELLTDRPPFAGGDMLEVLLHSLTERARPLAQLRPEIPRELSAIVDRALARNPAERYASGHELALALKEFRDRPLPEPGGAFVTRRRGLRRWATAALAASALIMFAWFQWGRVTKPVLAFNERDFVVVADVVNDAGDAVFDVALKTALETDLRQSRYVNVVDSNQVQTALRFSRLAADARLDTETGRTVCRRVGAQALLVPRILRAGEAYQLQVMLVEPSTGRVVDQVQVAARGREEVLLSAIDNLTRQLRGRLGESMTSIARADPPFAQYTTSSLEALQLLALGTKARDASDLQKAERYYQEALRRDPHFAAARGSLGLILIQFLNRPEEGRKMLAEALQEEGKVSEREYLSLRALNKQFVDKDLPGALEDYRFITELYPDLMPPYNNSGRILEELGRFNEAAAMFERAQKADPRSPVPLWNAYYLSVGRLKDPGRAERSARALRGLLPDNAHVMHALAWSLVAERRFAEAEDAMRATLKLDPSHTFALPNLAHLLSRRAAWNEAVTTYREIMGQLKEGRLKTDLGHLELCLGLALAANGEDAEARRRLLDAADGIHARARSRALPREEQAIRASLLAAAGRKDEARTLAESAGRGEPTLDVSYELARTWALLGDRRRALLCLGQAFAAGYRDTYFILIDPPFASIRNDPSFETLAPGPTQSGS